MLFVANVREMRVTGFCLFVLHLLLIVTFKCFNYWKGVIYFKFLCYFRTVQGFLYLASSLNISLWGIWTLKSLKIVRKFVGIRCFFEGHNLELAFCNIIAILFPLKFRSLINILYLLRDLLVFIQTHLIVFSERTFSWCHILCLYCVKIFWKDSMWGLALLYAV